MTRHQQALERTRRQMLIAIGSAFAATAFAQRSYAQATPPALPTDSLYQLGIALEDQSGQTRPFAAYRGEARIVAMFYANCPHVCPLTIETIKLVDQQLTAAQQSKLKFLMLSIDPARDTPAVLTKLAEQRDAKAPRWTLARTAPSEVRKLAAVLGVQYSQLADKEFNHSTILSLVDADGRIRARTSKLGAVDRAFITAVRTVLDDGGG
ncbi:MAG: SCO family protein [Burkholderiales bacterium]